MSTPEPEPEPTPPVFTPAPIEYQSLGQTVTEDEDGVLRRDDGIIQAQSMCTECEENGMTTFLPTIIPHFKKVIVSSFRCDCCGHRNSELQIADYEDKGCRYQLKVEGAESLNRQIVKSDRATINIPELEFEIPVSPDSKSLITTLEGFLVQHIENLEEGQPVRRIMDADTAAKIDTFLGELRKCAEGKLPFTLIVRDPSGNSYIENPDAPKPDPNLRTAFFSRSEEDNEALGINVDADGTGEAQPYKVESDSTLEIQGGEELAQFPESCYACGSTGILKMVVTTIPHFKEIVLMCFTCDACGYKSVDVKPGGEVCKQGVQFALSVGAERDATVDLSRDVIKSADAGIIIPEIELELAPGTLGGLFTTVEGLLSQARDHLTSSNPLAFTLGDADTGGTGLSVSGDDGGGKEASAEEVKARADKKETKQYDGAYGKFIAQLNDCIDGKKMFTLILRDPTGNSYLQALDETDDGWGVLGKTTENSAARDHESYIVDGMQAPTEAGEDPRLSRTYFERTPEEDADLGLSDMRTVWNEETQEWSAPSGVAADSRSPEELAFAADEYRKKYGGNYVSGAGQVAQRRARASHLLVIDEALCAEIKQQLDAVAGGGLTEVASKFSSLASTHSKCESAGQGGLLGSFPPGKMVAAFDAVIFGEVDGEGDGGEVGVVHGPVETQFGHHLILIHERNY